MKREKTYTQESSERICISSLQSETENLREENSSKTHAIVLNISIRHMV